MQLSTFIAGHDVTLAIPLKNSDGVQLDVVSITGKLYDAAGALLVDHGSITFAAHTQTLAYTALAAYNALVDPVRRDVRKLILQLTLNDGSVYPLTAFYALRQAEILVQGVNSVQSYTEALATSLGLGNTPNFDMASEDARCGALESAWHALDNLSYQDPYLCEPLVYSRAMPWVAALGVWRLSLLTPSEWAALPDRFKAALRRAQVAEADALLDTGSGSYLRDQGVMMRKVGESTDMYRASKPLDVGVSRRALKELTGYVTFSLRIGRS